MLLSGLWKPTSLEMQIPPLRPKTLTDQEIESQILGVDPLIRAMIRKRMRVSLDPANLSRDNQDALEIYGDVWLALFRKLNATAAEIQNLRQFAAAVTSNTFSDYLRRRYPHRHSLSNKLRYFIENTPSYGIWMQGDETLCGFAGWPGQKAQRASAERIATLGGDRGSHQLELGRIPAVAKMNRVHWSSLLDSIFHYLAGPIEWHELVAAVAFALGVKDHEPEEPSVERPSTAPSPYEQARQLELLRKLWTEIINLDPRWRAAFLLNPPMGAEIEIFVQHGIATIRAIGLLLAFSDSQFERVWQQLPPKSDGRVQALETYDQKFAFFWNQLPIRDAFIGLLIDRTAQQVIALRRLARERLCERLFR
jgi:hypothetical protein